MEEPSNITSGSAINDERNSELPPPPVPDDLDDGAVLSVEEEEEGGGGEEEVDNEEEDEDNDNEEEEEEEVIEFVTAVARSTSIQEMAASAMAATSTAADASATAAATKEKKKKHVEPSADDYDNDNNMEDESYILGTLIVRIVAARGLVVPPTRTKGGGWFGSSGSSSSSSTKPDCHSYALVRLGQHEASAQRTTQVFYSTNPTWPRGESLYLDVLHPPPPPSLEPKDDPNDSLVDNNNGNDKVVPIVTPGDPPTKPGKGPTSASALSKNSSNVGEKSNLRIPPRPVLTVALFHQPDAPTATTVSSAQQALYNPTKPSSGSSGDSDDVFLGMTAVDVTSLLTGRQPLLDAWLPLQPSGAVRVVCEYESSDAVPLPGQVVCLTRYCQPRDVYPLQHDVWYAVGNPTDDDEHHGDDQHLQHSPHDDQEYVTLAYPTPEGWVCTVTAHRYMVMGQQYPSGDDRENSFHFANRSSERGGNPLQVCTEELSHLTQRLSRSPMVEVVRESVVQTIPDQGLVAVGVSALQGAGGLFQKWLQQGAQAALDDVLHATNLDGHADPPPPPPASSVLAHDNDDDHDEDGFFEARQEEHEPNDSLPPLGQDALSKPPPQYSSRSSGNEEPLPNMPSCPITGEPMLDPVVAADGHTYERAAMARWLQESDKSPLTGQVLPHKNLVPNYMLLSSLQPQKPQQPATCTDVATSTALNQTTRATSDKDDLSLLPPGITLTPSPDDLEDQDLA